MTIIPPDEDRDQRLTVNELARLGDTEFFGVLNRSWDDDVQAAEEAGEVDDLYDGHLIVGGLNRLHAGQVRTEDGLRQLQGVVRRTQDAVARELGEVAAAQAATDARVTTTNTEVDRIRTFVQSYDSPLSWVVDITCVVIIVWGSYLLYLSQDLFTSQRVVGTILVDIILIGIALAITSHIRRLDDPPAPPAPAGNGAAEPQPAPVAQQANPAAPTEQIPVVQPPPPPPPAPPQANP